MYIIQPDFVPIQLLFTPLVQNLEFQIYGTQGLKILTQNQLIVLSGHLGCYFVESGTFFTKKLVHLLVFAVGLEVVHWLGLLQKMDQLDHNLENSDTRPPLILEQGSVNQLIGVLIRVEVVHTVLKLDIRRYIWILRWHRHLKLDHFAFVGAARRSFDLKLDAVAVFEIVVPKIVNQPYLGFRPV